MTERDSRALLIGGVVVALGWLGIRAVPSGWDQLRTAEARVVQKAELVSRGRQQLARLPALQDTVEQYERVSQSLHRRLLSGWDETTAQFDLARRLRDFLPDSQFGEVTVQSLGDSDTAADLRRVRVRAVVQIELERFFSVIRELETDSVLGIEEVAMVHLSQEETAPSAEQVLEARIDVTAWFLPDSTAARPLTDVSNP